MIFERILKISKGKLIKLKTLKELKEKKAKGK